MTEQRDIETVRGCLDRLKDEGHIHSYTLDEDGKFLVALQEDDGAMTTKVLDPTIVMAQVMCLSFLMDTGWDVRIV